MNYENINAIMYTIIILNYDDIKIQLDPEKSIFVFYCLQLQSFCNLYCFWSYPSKKYSTTSLNPST